MCLCLVLEPGNARLNIKGRLKVPLKPIHDTEDTEEVRYEDRP